jgi:hypothetical protein
MELQIENIYCHTAFFIPIYSKRGMAIGFVKVDVPKI